MSLIEIITIVVASIIVVTVFSVVIYKKLTGKSSCCDCKNCPASSNCKRQKTKDNK